MASFLAALSSLCPSITLKLIYRTSTFPLSFPFPNSIACQTQIEQANCSFQTFLIGICTKHAVVSHSPSHCSSSFDSMVPKSVWLFLNLWGRTIQNFLRGKFFHAANMRESLWPNTHGICEQQEHHKNSHTWVLVQWCFMLTLKQDEKRRNSQWIETGRFNVAALW